MVNCKDINDSIILKTLIAEKEPNSNKDQNDSFKTAEKITINSNLKGFIGAKNDIDCYQFSADVDGIITVRIDITNAFYEKNIWSLSAGIYTDTFLASNTSSAVTNPSVRGKNIIDRDTLKTSASFLEFKQSVAKIQKRYFLMITGSGDDDKYKGFDSENPYLLTIRFEKNKTLESNQPEFSQFEFKEADTWRCANEIQYDNKSFGTSIIKSYAYYWYDIDWYYFNADKDGWLRVSFDLTNHEDDDPYKTSINLHGSLYIKEKDSLEKTDLRIEALDSPGCPYTFKEYTEIKAFNKYYFKVFCFEYSKKIPYKLKFEYNYGEPEDNQPGEVKASDEPSTAFDLGTINIDETKKISSYFYHYFDNDYYKIKTSENSNGILTIYLNYKESFDKYGWMDELHCYKNPFGIKIWLYLYNSSIVDNSSDSGSFIKASLKRFSPYQEIIYNAKKNSTYYILLNSRANWDIDNTYVLEVKYKKIDPSYDYFTFNKYY